MDDIEFNDRRMVKLIIPGKPIPQARMRIWSKNGITRTYDPCHAEKNSAKYVLLQYENKEYFKHPRISFIFYMPIPRSIAKKDEKLYNSGRLKHEKTPDVDNLIKLYLDCLDKIFLDGDQNVSLGPSIKLYSPQPKTVIWIYETTNVVARNELDFAFLPMPDKAELQNEELQKA